MNRIIKGLNCVSSTNKALSIFWLIAISLSIIGIAFAATPNPGHDFTAIGGGAVQGDLFYGSAADTISALAKSTSATRYLSNTGASNNPAWAQVDLTNGVTGILPTANGGTGMAFFTVSGPASTAKTFTFPNANATVLTDNAAVTVAQGGTGLTASVSDAVLVGDSTSAYTARTLPASCAGTTAKLLYDSTTNLFSCGTDQTGSSGTANQYNQSTAAQGAGFATDTYLTGSSIAIPASSLKAGTRYHLIFNVSKTAAGTATPTLNVRFGTNGTTADTARCAITFTAQTAATDTGTFEVWTTFRTVGSGTSAVLQCVGQRRHQLTTTGLGNNIAQTVTVTSGGFDSTVANSIIGVSVNGGTSAAWTVQLVQAELTNLQ